MNKIIKVAIWGIALLSSHAFAGSGKAIVPHWTGNSGTNSPVFMSNISSHDVIVNVAFFDRDGNVLSPTAYNNLVSNSIL